MRLLGVDHGLRRIGLAISEGELAEPLGIAHSLEDVIKISQLQNIEKIIIGLPTAQNEKIESFGKRLWEITEIPVEYWDETLSTVTARSRRANSGAGAKKRRATIDDHAAAVILQSYLDAQDTSLPM
jgi:putative Holliday junction resolvase